MSDTPKGKRTAAIYARVSTKDKGQDVENQLLQLRDYCQRQGWQYVEYIDQASGKTGDREAFKRLFADASRRLCDVVVVWALDRFTREGVLETFEYIRELTRYDVQFESYTEAHFRTTGMAGELMLAITAWIAKQERLRITDRVNAGIARARLHGTKSGAAIGRPRAVFDRAAVVTAHLASMKNKSHSTGAASHNDNSVRSISGRGGLTSLPTPRPEMLAPAGRLRPLK